MLLGQDVSRGSHETGQKTPATPPVTSNRPTRLLSAFSMSSQGHTYQLLTRWVQRILLPGNSLGASRLTTGPRRLRAGEAGV